ncbi:hypothetical protein, partial [uncultured Nocardioides sp.]|uniref:hypothetical protein n=1 Tax=uncultured Nocardioides sp. TaxID=198441 RepID=UPI002608F851
MTLLAVYLATCSATPSVDTSSASLQGWRIATTGSPWLEDVDLDDLPVRYTDPPFWTGENETGHVVVYRSPGVTAVSTLAYLGRSSDPTTFSIRPASLLAAGLAWLAVLLVYGALRRHLSRRVALGVSAVLALGTPVWSVAADAMWPHTLTTLGIAGMAFAASRDRWLLAGLMGGIGLTGRLHLSLVVATLGLGAGVLRRRTRITVLVAAGSLPFLFLSAAWSRWLYGQWDPAGGYPQVDAYASRATSQSPLDLVVNHLAVPPLESFANLCDDTGNVVVEVRNTGGSSVFNVDLVENIGATSGLSFVPGSVEISVNGGPFVPGADPILSGANSNILSWNSVQIAALGRLYPRATATGGGDPSRPNFVRVRYRVGTDGEPFFNAPILNGTA